ncbi:MAG: hypothetical protein OEY34_04840, partial [Cyclobacteriaceae bacterium]|nr:hypothetical protein [Cyclobacteriaceae bacterium]
MTKAKALCLLFFLYVNFIYSQELKLGIPLGHSEGQVLTSVFSKNSKYILTTSPKDGTAKVWDVETGRIIYTILDPNAKIIRANFSPDMSIVATSTEMYIKLWRMKDGSLLKTLYRDSLDTQNENHLNHIEFGPDGKTLVVTDLKGKVLIYNIESNEPPKILIKHTDRVNKPVFSKSGKFLLTPSQDKTVGVWELSTGNIIQHIKGLKNGVKAVSIDEEYNEIFTFDGKLISWDLKTGKKILQLKEIDRYFESSEGDMVLYTINGNNKGFLYKYSDENYDVTLVGHESKIIYGQISDDTEKVTTVSLDGIVKVWNTNNGELIYSLKSSKTIISNAQFSPNNKYLITRGMGPSQIWDAKNGHLLHTLTGDAVEMKSARFSNNGEYLFIKYLDRNPDDNWKRNYFDNNDVTVEYSWTYDIVSQIREKNSGNLMWTGINFMDVKISNNSKNII